MDSTRRNTSCRERGATTAEYAIVLVVAVVILGFVLDGLTTTTTDAVAERGDQVGNPDDYFTPIDPGGETGGTVGEDILPPPGGPIDLRLEDLTNRRTAGDDPKWQASVDVVVTDTSGTTEPVPGVEVDGEWRIKSNNGWKNIPAECFTDDSGVCSMTVDGLQFFGNNPDDEAWFWFVTIVANGIEHTYDGTQDTTAYGVPPDGPAVLICRPGLVLVSNPPAPDTCVDA